MESATRLFARHYGPAPQYVAQAPGRLELLGNHTDYNAGLVMAIAVDKYVHMAASPRDDDRVRLVAAAFPQPAEFSVRDLRKDENAPWADYVKGVIDQLLRAGVRVGGFDAAIDGTIPMGAGMSSSAALEVATALAIRRLYPFHLREGAATDAASGKEPALDNPQRLELAKLCQRAENEFVGVKCGLLDQASSLFGKAGHAIEMDFESLAIEHAPLAGDVTIVTCSSGVKHELTGGEYNELRALCESAAKKLGARFLRGVSLKQLMEGRTGLTEREYECAHHVVTEIQRVAEGAEALQRHDLAEFGELMFQSHASSRDFFRNSTDQLDLLVALARAQPDCLGARLTGGGFGGATINLVRRAGLENFCRSMSLQYRQRSGIEMTPLICQIVDGAA
jgi:galactokinase